MADEIVDNIDRFQKILNDVEKRVEMLRDQALSIQREKERLLEILQDLQDNADQRSLSKADREDLECSTERLILRCLTVEASVSTPRNEVQEEAYCTVCKLLDNLMIDYRNESEKHYKKVESYLNACLPEPVSANIDTRFQSKLLGCTADDQKFFRKKLQDLYKEMKSKLHNSEEYTEHSLCNSEDDKKNGVCDRELASEKTTMSNEDGTTTDIVCNEQEHMEDHSDKKDCALGI